MKMKMAPKQVTEAPWETRGVATAAAAAGAIWKSTDNEGPTRKQDFYTDTSEAPPQRRHECVGTREGGVAQSLNGV